MVIQHIKSYETPRIDSGPVLIVELHDVREINPRFYDANGDFIFL